MKSWSAPALPVIASTAGADIPFELHDTVHGRVPIEVTPKDAEVGMYVCGITPYDATHLGHAATYVTFDILNRVLRDMGREVHYTQNVTDVDDPLLERADRDGIDWRDLARQEIELFHGDMEALRTLPPREYVGVVESMDLHIASVATLLEKGVAYKVDVPDGERLADGDADIYLDLSTQPTFGSVSGWTREQMMEVYADRGGDPEREGKRDKLDPLLWRAQRDGEPAWDGGPAVGMGRPGWHLECTSIALENLGMDFVLQGGGTDLIFPHHEMSAVQAVALTDTEPFAQHYAHQAMVAFDGEKMSKSKGNLVKVSVLRKEGIDPMAVRLVLLAQHYRTDWEYTPELLAAAQERLANWRQAALSDRGDAAPVIEAMRRAVRNDLTTADALVAVDAWADNADDEVVAGSAQAIIDAVDALLGIKLN